jgi:hypothetical protein
MAVTTLAKIPVICRPLQTPSGKRLVLRTLPRFVASASEQHQPQNVPVEQSQPSASQQESGISRRAPGSTDLVFGPSFGPSFGRLSRCGHEINHFFDAPDQFRDFARGWGGGVASAACVRSKVVTQSVAPCSFLGLRTLHFSRMPEVSWQR